MPERYDQDAAAHYAAYRPPLHAAILHRVLIKPRHFDLGLDIGCGTGYSTLALAPYCTHTIGIDPSHAMLEQAVPHANVSYLTGAGDAVPLSNDTVDLVTFAGALFYADSEATRTEVQRVCKPNARVVVYDFEILLEATLRRLDVATPATNSTYDHTINFSDRAGFTEHLVRSEQVDLSLTSEELAHVVLSDSNRLDVLAKASEHADLFTGLVHILGGEHSTHTLSAALYYALYSVNKRR